MNHAYLITAYKDPDQIAGLITHLQGENSFIFIHLDRKSSFTAKDVLAHLTSTRNVFFDPDPINVYWGGYSHLQAFLKLMKLSAENESIFYFHTISGQDFPVMSQALIQKYFTDNNGKEFLHFKKLRDANWTGGSFNRIQRYHLNDWFDIRGRIAKRLNAYFLRAQNAFSIKRKLAPYIEEYYAGGTWWSISRNAVNYIFDFLNEHPDFIKRFRHTHCAEEIFFHTILLNSPLKNNVVNDDLRFLDWETRNGSCPANLDETDFEKIVNSEKIFARKIHPVISRTLLDKLSGHLKPKSY